MCTRFTQRADCVSVLERLLRDSGVPTPVDHQVADAMVDDFADEILVPDALFAPTRHVSRSRSWAIRDDDLKFIDFVSNSIVAAAGAASGGALASVAAAAFVAVCKLVYTVLKKGAKLTPLQHKVLLALARTPNGLTSIELARCLQTTTEVGSALLIDDVAAVLRTLQGVVLADGTSASLVAVGSSGKWHPTGV